MRYLSVLEFIRNHVAMKVGLLLLSIFLLITLAVGNILYSLFLSFYSSHMIGELIQRSQTHASVLSDHFSPITIEHVVRMEHGSNFMVVILNNKGEIMGSSGPITSFHKKYFDQNKRRGETVDELLEQDWQTQPYLVSRSIVQSNHKTIGSVVLFSSTAPIRDAVRVLQGMLIGIGIVTILIVAGILFVISRMIVRPLVEMKKVTGNIARGYYSSRLPVEGQDEVGQLAYSINHMSDEIQFYQKQRNDFLADIGHELRTPLTYLKGYSEVLLHHTIDEKEKREYLMIIHEQSKRLQRLVQDLFDLTRMEQGDLSFCQELFYLDEVVTGVLTLTEASMDEKEISLEYDLPKTRTMIQGDYQRLEQVFINILENARRYTPEGGRINVSYIEDPNTITVLVKDNGPGIPRRDLPFIMERLYRIDKSRSQETGGAGLGLAISKKIVEMHGGRIWVESEEGVGTSFYVQLSIHQELKE